MSHVKYPCHAQNVPKKEVLHSTAAEEAPWAPTAGGRTAVHGGRGACYGLRIGA